MAWPSSSPAWDIISEKMYGAYYQLLAYNTNLFNEATRGGLVLSAGQIEGDFSTMSFFNRLSGLVRDRDITSDASVSSIDFSMDNISRVKYAKGTPPVRLDRHRWEWILKNPEDAVALISQQLVEETIAAQLALAAGALIAANTGVGATLTYDGTAGTTSLAGLTNAAQLFGDRSGDINCWLMHSKCYTDLQLAALTNASNLFQIGSVRVVQDAAGRPIVVSDLPTLVYTSTGTKYHVLGLTPGAVVVEAEQDFFFNVDTSNGTENIGSTWQAQWTENIGLKGFTYDTTNGGRNPTQATLLTSTNWDKKATSVKDCGAVLANFQ